MASDLKPLIDRLGPVCRRALEASAALCVSKTHYNVEVEHFLLQLLELEADDMRRLLERFDVDRAVLETQLGRVLDGFDRGNARTPAFSPQLVDLLRHAWLASSLRLGAGGVRSGAVFFALLDDDAARRAIVESAPALAAVDLPALEDELADLLRGSQEAKGDGTSPTGGGDAPPTASRGSTALARYTVDLTADARAGRIDPIRGREREIGQVIDILTRRRQNNPILVGDAGVGKTAVAEGFARRVVEGSLPTALAEVEVRTLDLALLQAGAGIQGEFEERLKTVIAEVAAAPRPVILFIDEAHTLIGAGGKAGQGDAANLLKPALARGTLRTIAATTWSEYKKYFEKDPALARRFQPVKIGEPDEDAAIDMLRGLVPKLEAHHGVRILDEAVRDAVRLSARYLAERKLPDKAISVLDTACARVALAQDALPERLREIDLQIDRASLEFDVLMRELVSRESAEGKRRAAEADELAESLDALRRQRADLDTRWQREREMVDDIHALQRELDALRSDTSPTDSAQSALDEADLAERLEALTAACRSYQGERPMVPIAVDGAVAAAVISGWTGVPAGRMARDEIDDVLGLEERLAERLVGQPQALDVLCRRIHTSSAGLEDPGRPRGVFLLVGPTGVGKTETATLLAELLYGGAQTLVSVNMSELQEAHSVATLRGAPPGYVGYGQGGVLTEAVRRRPHSVVLLDEIEKAHRDVVELFYQVFDKGVLEDGEGVAVDFKHTVILMTSNLGAEVLAHWPTDEHSEVDLEEVRAALRPALAARFPAAFLGRVVVVPYFALGADDLRAIVELKLSTVRRRVAEGHSADLTWDDALLAALARQSDAGESGARTIDHVLTQTLLPELSGRLLERLARGEATHRISLGWRGEPVYELE
ncbi:MAG: type VI secretion system ATPase TssH [Acidobacteriota bacterium]